MNKPPPRGKKGSTESRANADSKLTFLPMNLIITYEELASILKSVNSPLSADALIGFMTGLNAAPRVIMPSKFLPVILGDYVFKDLQETERVLASMMSFHNQILPGLNLAQPVTLQGWYPSTLKGLESQLEALQERMLWFMRGVDMSGGGTEKLTVHCRAQFEGLARLNNMIDGMFGLIKRRKVTNDEIAGFVEQFTGCCEIADRLCAEIILGARKLHRAN